MRLFPSGTPLQTIVLIHGSGDTNGSREEHAAGGAWAEAGINGNGPDKGGGGGRGSDSLGQ